MSDTPENQPVQTPAAAPAAPHPAPNPSAANQGSGTQSAGTQSGGAQAAGTQSAPGTVGAAPGVRLGSGLPPSPPARRFDPAVLAIVAGVVVLGGALAFLFLNNPNAAPSAESTRSLVVALQKRVDQLEAANIGGLQAKLEADETRMAALEKAAQELASRPPGDPTNKPAIEALGARLDGIDTREATASKRVDDSLAALEADLTQRRQAQEARRVETEKQVSDRLSAIENNAGQAARENTQRIAAVEGRVGEVENRAAARAAEAERNLSQRIADAEKQIAQRVADAEAAIAPRLAALDQTIAQRVDAATQQMDKRVAEQNAALDTRLATFDQRVQQAESAERRVGFLAARGAIQSALEAGRPLKTALGNLPGTAPAALTRYADAAPPTEASLRLSFEDAARAARAAAEPQGQGAMDSALARIQGLVTVRRGDQVVVGDTVSGTLERARRALDAGDLAKAVAELDTMGPQPKAAMQNWLDQAQGLLSAQVALRDLSAQDGGTAPATATPSGAAPSGTAPAGATRSGSGG
ncbi:COG4223 family protein [Roseomonas elaeocarpi]|uniref:Mitofilin family membrane protein n=1 Tax=Roseomonas elaeocarpi TaxID=907779 RepID=A0ABV6JTC5_9PROT